MPLTARRPPFAAFVAIALLCALALAPAAFAGTRPTIGSVHSSYRLYNPRVRVVINTSKIAHLYVSMRGDAFFRSGSVTRVSSQGGREVWVAENLAAIHFRRNRYQVDITACLYRGGCTTTHRKFSVSDPGERHIKPTIAPPQVNYDPVSGTVSTTVHATNADSIDVGSIDNDGGKNLSLVPGTGQVHHSNTTGSFRGVFTGANMLKPVGPHIIYVSACNTLIDRCTTRTASF